MPFQTHQQFQTGQIPTGSPRRPQLANGFNANLVRKWMRDRRVSDIAAKSASKLVPVTLDAEPGRELPRRMRVPTRAPVRNAGAGSMEIRIGTIELVVHGLVDRAQLAEVLDRLLGR